MEAIIVLAIVIIIMIWVFSGGSKLRTIICPACNGSGCPLCGDRGRLHQTWDECTDCQGSGYIKKQVRRRATAEHDTYYENESINCPDCGGTGKRWVP